MIVLDGRRYCISEQKWIYTSKWDDDIVPCLYSFGQSDCSSLNVGEPYVYRCMDDYVKQGYATVEEGDKNLFVLVNKIDDYLGVFQSFSNNKQLFVANQHAMKSICESCARVLCNKNPEVCTHVKI